MFIQGCSWLFSEAYSKEWASKPLAACMEEKPQSELLLLSRFMYDYMMDQIFGSYQVCDYLCILISYWPFIPMKKALIFACYHAIVPCFNNCDFGSFTSFLCHIFIIYFPYHWYKMAESIKIFLICFVFTIHSFISLVVVGVKVV